METCAPKLTLENVILCPNHNIPLSYFCTNKGCETKFLNCGDCLYENHGDHMKKVLRISSVVESLNEKYQLFRKENSEDTQRDQHLDKINEKLQNQNDQMKVILIDFIQQKLEKTFQRLDLEQAKLINYQKDPIKQYTEMQKFFSSFDSCDDKAYLWKVSELIELEKKLSDLQSNSTKALIQEVDVGKIESNLSKCITNFEHRQEADLAQLVKGLNFASSVLKMSNINVFHFTWNQEKSNDLTISELIVRPNGGCKTDRYVLSNEMLPHNISYLEVIKSHTNGCYDSLGVCTNKQTHIRNGVNADGWALRLYGDHSDLTFSGSIHNNIQEKFAIQWVADDRVGMLYNPMKRELSYFRNGEYLGTPFKDVEGELFVCLEVCHHGSFTIKDNAELPSDERYKDLL